MEKRVLVEAEEIQRILTRMAHEIVEKNDGAEGLALVGIRSRGAHLVQRLAKKIASFSGSAPAVGIVDITPYRDDVTKTDAIAVDAVPAKLPLTVDEKTVVLVDDVIYTGRTIRAALDLVGHLGKPKKILVATLVDRGQRELPIRADIVGKNVQVEPSQRVNVLVEEQDGIDRVVAMKLETSFRTHGRGA